LIASAWSSSGLVGIRFVIKEWMRWIPVIAILFMLGCAASPRGQADRSRTEPDFDAAQAAALVFDPPVIAHSPPLELARAPREPSAFLGFDGPIVEYHWLLTDDRQSSGVWGRQDRYEREFISERMGIRVR
jgi:hypothetical protein